MSGKGFFSKQELLLPLSDIRTIKDNCLACGLYKGCKSPKMLATGDGKRELLVIAEAPGRMEDEQGIQLVGEAGRLFRNKLSKCGVELDRDCVKVNSVNCRPERNKTPTNKEIEYCRPRVWDVIREMKPKVILLLGGAALESFLGHRWRRALGGISTWRGFSIPDRDVGAWVVPTFHPSYVNRSQGQPVVELIFEQDIEQALRLLDTPFPVFQDETKQVEFVEELNVVNVMKKLYHDYEGGLVAFDYETTGLKPQVQGHRVVCMSICYTMDKAFSFMMPPRSSQAFRWISRFLQDEYIKKTGHNIKFEDTWSEVILGVLVRGWEWCSMQAAHICDNRPGIVGLKSQVYLNFGLIGYDSSITSYLDGRNKKDGANGFNSIDKAPRDELLLYCGLDSLFQWRLARKQRQEI